jgi:hypothetical protein
MAAFDGAEFGRQIVDEVNASIDRCIAPLLKRLEALEASTIADDMKGVRTDLRLIVETVSAIPVIKDDAIRALVDEAVSKAVEGTDELILIAAEKAVAALELPAPIPGKDADPIDMDAVRTMIVEECKDIRAGLESTIGPEMQTALSVMVSEAVKAIELPQLPEIELPDIAGMIDERVKAIELPAAPELPDIAGMVKELSDAAELRSNMQIKDAFDTYRKSEFHANLSEAVSKAVADIPVPTAPELPDIAAMVDDAVKAIELPAPIPGKDADPIDMDVVKELIGAAVSAIEIPVPREPVDVDMDGVYRRVDEVLAVVKADVASIRIPEDGKSVTLDEVKPLIDDAVSKAVAALPPARDGKDGADVMDAVIDRLGHLILTFSNGKTKDVGQVVGDDGVDCDFDGVWKLINAKLDSWPKPKDGIGFDDLSVEYDGERTFKFVMSRGDQRKEYAFDVPVLIYRDLYSDAKTYVRGDSVTWDGSIWHAQVDGAKEKPGTGKEWRLAVKKGKPGKDGVMTVPRANVPVKLGV